MDDRIKVNISNKLYLSNFVYSLQYFPLRLISLQSHKSLLMHSPPLQSNSHFGI